MVHEESEIHMDKSTIQFYEERLTVAPTLRSTVLFSLGVSTHMSAGDGQYDQMSEFKPCLHSPVVAMANTW